jgi:hypothetical protein
MSVGFIPTLSAQAQTTRRPFLELGERLTRVDLVFELDHRLTLLEPFKTTHKGKFG